MFRVQDVEHPGQTDGKSLWVLHGASRSLLCLSGERPARWTCVRLTAVHCSPEQCGWQGTFGILLSRREAQHGQGRHVYREYVRS